MAATDDPFFEAYDREEIAYGEVPSAPLFEYLTQIGGSGNALDLGAGAGRDTISMAKAGFQVTTVDLSARGAERIQQRAAEAGVSGHVQTKVADVCDVSIEQEYYDLICATTILDHISDANAKSVWERIVAGLTEKGALYVEVHSTEDPGSEIGPGKLSRAPVSETADAVINYFPPNKLARWAINANPELRILHYEERLEWDYTHGPEHLHGKAILLAVRQGHHLPWYGSPPRFKQRVD